MAAKKGGLGKGLDSLITDKVNKPGAAKDTSLTPTEDQAVMVPINKVEPNKEQPRKHFNEDALLELSESIQTDSWSPSIRYFVISTSFGIGF